MLIPGASLWTSNTTTTAIVYPTERSCHLVHITGFVCSMSYAPWYAPCSHGEQQSHAWFCSTHHILHYFHRMFHWRPIHGISPVKHYTAVPSSLCMTDELSHAQTTVHAITCHIGIRQSPLFLSTVSFLTKQMKNELLIVRNSRNCDPREAENISGTPPRVVILIPTRFVSILSLYGAETNLKAENSLFATSKRTSKRLIKNGPTYAANVVNIIYIRI